MTPPDDREYSRLVSIEAAIVVLQDRMKNVESTCRSCSLNTSNKISDSAAIGHTDIAALSLRFEAISERLRSLEIRVAFFAGGAALLGAIGGAVFSHVWP